MRLPITNILAVDPGQKSGWGLLTTSNVYTSGEQAYDRMISDVEDTALACARAGVPLVLAVERANINTNKGGRGILRSLAWEMETIGCVKHFARKFGHRILQVNKADAANFAPNKLLQELGWWHEGGDGHARDAARVLACAVVQFDLDFWRELVVDKGVLDREERRGEG